MSKLAVIANKMPVRPVKTGAGGWRLERGEGGLVAALNPVLLARGGSWFGNDATPVEAWDAVRAKVGYEVHPVSVPREVQNGFYNGFCNAMLWPLFHDFLGRAEFNLKWWNAYYKANEIFAEAVAPRIGNSDIWVHDYHFFLLPEFLRQRRVRKYIRFFLHIPFPAFEIFRHIPWRNELLSGLVAADEVGFHTALYRDNFLGSVARLWGSKYVQGDSIRRPGGGRCQARVLPISVDTAALAKAGEKPEVQQRIGELRAGGRALVLGVDRLDYTKGMPERMTAYEHFLERNPEQHGRVSLIQIAVPSRDEVTEYGRHKRYLEQLIGHINGRFGTADWTPVRYIHRHVNPNELTAMYKAADVALVTPLADGMNLVAKEYVAVKAGAPGVLILSEFAGAAAELTPHALLVNPHNTEGVAGAISKALAMPAGDRQSRMKAMYLHLKEHDIHAWVARALAPENELSQTAS
jgi:alpha,alpha-trehalose-phosphate synthase [UDP-forming]